MSTRPYVALVDFRALTIGRAFILNAFVIALIAGISIEVRSVLDVTGMTRSLSRSAKMGLTITATFFIGLLVYLVARLLFGFGGGMLSADVQYPLL